MAFWCCRWHRWHQKIDMLLNSISIFVPLTLLTSKKLFTSNFFLYFAVDTVDIWKNTNLSKKNLKSTVRWLSDAAVDAVDIRNWFVSQFVFVFLPLTLLTSQKLFTSKFFSLLYCWHCWHLKKHEYVKEKHQKHCQMAFWCCCWHRWHQKIDMSANIFFCIFTVDAVDNKKKYSHPNFFSVLCRWHRWHLKKHECFKEELKDQC